MHKKPDFEEGSHPRKRGREPHAEKSEQKPN